MKNQLKDYLKTLTFGLKDFDKTKEKWTKYRSKDFEAILENSFAINQYFDYIKDNIQYTLLGNYYIQDMINEIKKELNAGRLSKKNIRLLKTNINYATEETNKRFIEGLLDIEEIHYTRNHSFAITFYLKYYDLINEAMQEVLEDNLFGLID